MKMMKMTKIKLKVYLDYDDADGGSYIFEFQNNNTPVCGLERYESRNYYFLSSFPKNNKFKNRLLPYLESC